MSSDTRSQMNAMYRLTRHVYDASRKYYLLGRDRLIAGLAPDNGARICEIGCGTARNLIKLAWRYPDARFYGLDASDEMLKTAHKSLEKNKLGQAVILKQGFAQNFDPATLFDLDMPFDAFVFSYALSIIPPWRESIDHALDLLPAGGALHIVDFGGMEDLPPVFRRFVFWWLSLFHVYHKPEILVHLQALQQSGKGALRVETLYGGYAYIAVFEKA
ncbi:MAG: class I SAM-dependent methyltransferase [Bdellovibrionales bacterium]